MEELKAPVVKVVGEDEVSGKAREIFEMMKAKTGKVPKWMRVMANCEDTLVGFFSLFKSLMDDAPTDKILKWKIALVVSDLNKCEYCVSVSKMQLKALGLTDDDLDKLDAVSDEKELLAIEYAKAVNDEAYKIDDELILKMKENFSDQQLVEITAVVGLFNFINRFNDALRVFPETK